MVTFDDRVDPGYPGDAQPDLFGQPEPPEAPTEPAWTHLDHDGARWRHRLHKDRLRERPLGLDASERKIAPGTYAWELEKLVDGEWRSVRYYQRRDEIWTHITGESPGGD